MALLYKSLVISFVRLPSFFLQKLCVCWYFPSTLTYGAAQLVKERTNADGLASMK